MAAAAAAPAAIQYNNVRAVTRVNPINFKKTEGIEQLATAGLSVIDVTESNSAHGVEPGTYLARIDATGLADVISAALTDRQVALLVSEEEGVQTNTEVLEVQA